MEFTIGNTVIFLPPLWMTIALIIMVILLIQWRKRSQLNPLTLFFYGLISSLTAPFTVQKIVVWIPIGFIAISFYLYGSGRYHLYKLIASIVGLFLALHQIVSKFIE